MTEILEELELLAVVHGLAKMEQMEGWPEVVEAAVAPRPAKLAMQLVRLLALLNLTHLSWAVEMMVGVEAAAVVGCVKDHPEVGGAQLMEGVVEVLEG